MRALLKKRVLVMVVLLSAILLLVNCSHDNEHHESFIDGLKVHDSAITYSEINDYHNLKNLIQVYADMEGVDSFFVEGRTQEITSFPCSECHSESLDEIKKLGSGNKKAHWDIHVLHAETATMDCNTCHGSGNMDQLISITGEVISLDESYKLCGQCHSSQLTDWKGGAHGKQLNGWKPPRVAKTCVGCHNPHKPSFEQRFPARYNTHNLEEE
jgi:formate-dependent nitrite reductase cytochrome c552 subunit